MDAEEYLDLAWNAHLESKDDEEIDFILRRLSSIRMILGRMKIVAIHIIISENMSLPSRILQRQSKSFRNMTKHIKIERRHIERWE